MPKIGQISLKKAGKEKDKGMAQIVKGIDVAKNIREKLQERIKALAEKNVAAKLVILGVGDDPANASYERGIMKVCGELGITVEKVVLDPAINQEGFNARFTEINEDASVSGILVFRPLPKPLDISFAANTINPVKDIDCISPVNQAKLVMGTTDGYYPCTAEAVLSFLEYENMDLAYKNVVIIGRSLVVGRPLVSMLIARNATVTCCHTKTADITDRISNADVVVCAAGKAGLLTADMMKNAKPECFVIDVGINMKPDGSGICGDVDFDGVEAVAGKITKVPGGVGSVTSTILAQHVVRAAETLNE